jgi:WD40 repeat protein
MVVAPRGPTRATSEVASLRDLRGPPDAEPVALRNGSVKWTNSAAFDPQGLWLATAHADSAVLWPLQRKYARVLRGHSPPYVVVGFTPDGSRLVSSSDDGTVRLWPLSSQEGERSRILMEDETALLGTPIAVHPAGESVLVASRFDPRVFVVPLDGGVSRPMPGLSRGQGWVLGLAFSPDGRLAVAAGVRLLRVWDLVTGEMRTLDTRLQPDECAEQPQSVGAVEFLSDGQLLTAGDGGVRVWDLERGTSRQIRPCRTETDQFLATNQDRRALVLYVDPVARTSMFGSLDLEAGSFQEISAHGRTVSAVALDPTGTIVVTGDLDGVVRVGPITGETPHLLLGHNLEISSVAVSPDGKWIASGSQDGTIRLWPMPEGMPFHTLPYEEILERLRRFTNLRVVPDGSSYRVEIGPFPGWNKLPTW